MATDDSYREARSVEELTRRNVQTIVELERQARANCTLADKGAHFVARFCGSVIFVWVHVLWFGLWVAFNTLPGGHHFDPYPFTFLTLVVSLEAIFLSTFILISQNRDSRVSERRNHLDLQINLLSEQENTKMLTMLERISTKLGIEDDEDPSLRVLDQATRPDKLVEQIEAATRLNARD